MCKDPIWWLTKDGDKSCLALYERHYSAHQYRDGRPRYQFVGPGFNIVLRTARADAFFVWRKFIDDSGQIGVNCAAFRNESPHTSSELIRQADAIADHAWPGERHYTYVDPEKIRRANPRWRRGNAAKPGHCFLKAGWSRCGMSKSGLIILERLPQSPQETE